VTTKRSQVVKAVPSAPVAKQRRSQITYEKLIKAGFKLLENRDFESISIAEIAKEAGYSVGAFYSRFENKEEYFTALFHQFHERRREETAAFFAENRDRDLPALYIERTVRWVWRSRFLWRAGLRRSLEDPDFWKPFRYLSRQAADKMNAIKAEKIGRPLTDDEQKNVQFAVQLVHGTINNAMVNRPGPFMPEDHDFQKRLIEAFRLVSRYNDLS